MPLEPPIVLSGTAHSPCPESENAGQGLALPVDHRTNYLPVVDLSRRLAGLLALNVGLAERLPHFIWRTTPGPMPACRELDDLITHLQEIEDAANAARMACLFLWEIAAAESERLRSAELPCPASAPWSSP